MAIRKLVRLYKEEFFCCASQSTVQITDALMICHTAWHGHDYHCCSVCPSSAAIVRQQMERETREMLYPYQKQRAPPSQSPNLARAKASSVSVELMLSLA